MANKFLLILQGPLGAGKSTVAKLLSENAKGVFHISGDKIKWFISDYSAKKYSGNGVVGRLLLSLVSQAAKENLSIIIEGNVATIKYDAKAYSDVAKENNMNFVQVNIEAPYNVLLDRFKQRVKNATEQKTKISLTSVKDMKNRYGAYQKFKNNNLPTFDSSVMSPVDISKKIKSIYNH